MSESLIDYAKENGKRAHGRACSVCSHPLRAELDAAYISGVRYKAMRGWLRDVHDDDALTQPALVNHYQREHHLA